MNKGQIETFVIDFLYIKECNETIKNSVVKFSEKNQYIEINGNKEYFDPYYIKEDGLSKDNLYYKIFTPQFGFWVNLTDYQRFLSVLKFRQDLRARNKQLIIERDKLNAENHVEFDDIDSSIYKCFIAHQSGLNLRVGTWKQFMEVEKAIEDICYKNNGRYYKSESKKANFVIIFSPFCRLYTIVSNFKEKGFKVTTFENVVEYFKLTHLFNIEKLIQEINYIEKYR